WSLMIRLLSRLLAETYYPKPSISLRPSRGVALGRAVTLRCRGQHRNMRFLLYKDGNPNALQDVEPAGDVTRFPIRSVSRRDAGSYSCRYSTKSDPPVWSEPSDPVELVVAGEGPGSASPLPVPHPPEPLGGSHPGGTLRYAEPAGDLAEFPISNVSRRDAGSYSCYYHHKWYPFIWSYPSDPVELVVAGEGPGSVSPIPAPHPAGPSGQRHVQGRKQAQAPRISGSGAQNSSGEQSPAGSTQILPLPCPSPAPAPPTSRPLRTPNPPPTPCPLTAASWDPCP
uniref:Ig-like domain-containing protein n=1 Tax=Chrysemys picta bellii TaxID=8478 RepID=A0A8C3HTV5_CHRPI